MDVGAQQQARVVSKGLTEMAALTQVVLRLSGRGACIPQLGGNDLQALVETDCTAVSWYRRHALAGVKVDDLGAARDLPRGAGGEHGCEM